MKEMVKNREIEHLNLIFAMQYALDEVKQWNNKVAETEVYNNMFVSDDGTVFFIGNDTGIVSKHVDAEVQRDKAIERFQEAHKRFVQFMEKEGKTNGK